MKTSVIASTLLASLALAAPLDRRARLTKTEVVTTTVYSTVTVYDDEPAPAATSSQGLFYEQPPSSAPVAPTSAPVVVPAPVPSVQAQPSSYVPTPTPAAPAPVVTSAAPVVAPQPSVAAAAPTSAPAPAPAQPSSAPSTGGYAYTNVDMTVYNGYGSKGACGTVLDDSQIFFALSKGVFGDSTYNIMTGAATNTWCNAVITVEYNGKTVTGPVVDRCAGCAGTNDVDLSPAAWEALGLVVADGGRYKANWSKA